MLISKSYFENSYRCIRVSLDWKVYDVIRDSNFMKYKILKYFTKVFHFFFYFSLNFGTALFSIKLYEPNLARIVQASVGTITSARIGWSHEGTLYLLYIYSLYFRKFKHTSSLSFNRYTRNQEDAIIFQQLLASVFLSSNSEPWL